MMQGSLAERLRVLRAQRGLTLVEAAEKTGVGRDTLSDLERGRRHPVMTTLAKIAIGYGVPVEELLEEATVPLGEALEAGLLSLTEPPEGSKEERLLGTLCRRLIVDLEKDANRWEEAAKKVASDGEVISSPVYREVRARRASIQNNLNALDDVSKALGIDVRDRRGSPLRRVQRDLQSSYNRWNAARWKLIEIHFNSLTEPQRTELRARHEELEKEPIQTKWLDGVAA